MISVFVATTVRVVFHNKNWNAFKTLKHCICLNLGAVHEMQIPLIRKSFIHNEIWVIVLVDECFVGFFCLL